MKEAHIYMGDKKLFTVDLDHNVPDSNIEYNYKREFKRIQMYLSMISQSSNEPFRTLAEAENYRKNVKEAANTAMCYIPSEVK